MQNLRHFFMTFRDRAMLWFRVKLLADGLEVSDHAIRWCRFDEGVPTGGVIPLSPGVMQDGKIIDRAAYIAALRDTRAALLGNAAQSREKQEVVTLSLGSSPTFMRLFYLPRVDRKNLETSVVLNLQMIAPSEGTATNAGWQLIQEDEAKNRFEITGAFISRDLMDDMVGALREAGFLVIAAESKAISLARVIAKGYGQNIDRGGRYIAIYVDDVGMDFSIIRDGMLGFEYAIPWHEIADAQGAVAGDVFAMALVRGFRQIDNFYRQHWTDGPDAIVIAAGDLFSQVQSVLAPYVAQPVMPFQATADTGIGAIPIAWGAALRGFSVGEKENSMTLLGADATGIYQEQKTIFFLRFWRVVMPMVLAVMLGVAVLGDVMLFDGGNKAVVSKETPTTPPAAVGQLTSLIATVQTFNGAVAMVSAIESASQPKYNAISKIQTIAAGSGVTLTHVSLAGAGAPVSISGSAVSEDAVVAFKNAIAASGLVANVSLPLSAIQQSGNTYTFTMTMTWQ